MRLLRAFVVPLTLALASAALLSASPAGEQIDVFTAGTDDARTFPGKRVLHSGPSAYSCLVSLDANRAGCLCERGDQGPYEKITCAIFPVTAVK